MYLHSHSAGSSRDFKAKPVTLMERTVGRELLNAALSRTVLKDHTSSKLNVKGPKQAEALQKAEIAHLRGELKALPEGLREDARVNYLLDQNIKRKNLQDFQCAMIGKVALLLKKNIVDNGEDYRKYKVGGYDKGTYERFFRVEPARYMSKAQLTTALRRSFGDHVIQSESAISKLFDSFDFGRTDEMDWRAFLYMLTTLMQPYFFCDSLMRWGYAIYSSVGSLDLNCSESLSIGMTKDLICTPVILSMRNFIKHEFDTAWLYLSTTDTDTILYAAKKTSSVAARAADPDDLKITFRILNKILLQTGFSKYMETATVYGVRDTRTWTCVLEEMYYHPRVLKELKSLRREERSNAEADNFIAMRLKRIKKNIVIIWKEYTRKRNFVRFVLIGGEVRSQTGAYSLYFDHWRRVTLETQCRLLLQRVARGYIARCRRHFIRRLRAKATLIQSNTRKLFAFKRYTQQTTRMNWAVCTIQRFFRGIHARRRIATIVEATYDTRKRQLDRQRNVWLLWRQVRAVIGIQTNVRRYLRRCREIKKEEQDERIAKIEQAQNAETEKNRVSLEVYKANLSKWYVERKQQYDQDTLNENQTAQDRKLIFDRRNRAKKLLQQEKDAERAAKLARIEEEKTEIWLKAWEERIAKVGKDRRERCHQSLVMPETPEDVTLKADLQVRIKAQIKDVLRRADKLKIPMEIPEAYEKATTEIIDFECEAAMGRCRELMQQEALRLQAAEQEKEKKQRDDEAKARKRRRKWAAVIMQGYAKTFLARKILRHAAYKRYMKYFDVESHNYYYEDTRTHAMSWEKPKSLGSYDITMADYWIIMYAKTAAGEQINITIEALTDPEDEQSEKYLVSVPLVYYYNPSTWKQTWDRPEGTVLCQVCNVDFAMRRLNADECVYCEACFAPAAQAQVDAGVHPKYVTFKPFQGGSQNAYRTDFYNIKDDSWFNLILDMNPALKQSEAEEVAAIKRARKRAELQASRSGKSDKSGKSNKLNSGSRKNNQVARYGEPETKKSILELCGVCDDAIAILTCVECALLYCQNCCDMAHSIASHAYHTISTFIPPTEGEEENNDKLLLTNAPAGDHKASHADKKTEKKAKKDKKEKKAKRVNEKSDAESSVYPTDVEDSDLDASFLHKPNFGPSASQDASSVGGKHKKKDKGDKKEHKEKSPKKHKHTTLNDASNYLTDASDTDAASRTSKPKNHKKSHEDRAEKGLSYGPSSGLSDTEGAKKKTHKEKKDKKEKKAHGTDASTPSSPEKPHKHKHRESAESGADTDASALSPDKPAKSPKKQKKDKKEKKEKHHAFSDADLSALSDTGNDTAHSPDIRREKKSKKEKKAHKEKKHHRHDSSSAVDTDTDAAPHHAQENPSFEPENAPESIDAMSDALAELDLQDHSDHPRADETPSKPHKKKHKKDKKDKKSASDGEVFSPGSDFESDYLSSPDKPSKAGKKEKKHKKHKRDASASESEAEHPPLKRSITDNTAGSFKSLGSFKLPNIFQKSNSFYNNSNNTNNAAQADSAGGILKKEKKHKKHKSDSEASDGERARKHKHHKHKDRDQSDAESGTDSKHRHKHKHKKQSD